MSIKQEGLVQEHKEFYKREASGKVNSDEVPPGLLRFSLFPPPQLISDMKKREKGTVYVRRGMTICG